MVYFMLTRGEEYVDQGHERYEKLQRLRSIAALKRRAAALGFQIATSCRGTGRARNRSDVGKAAQVGADLQQQLHHDAHAQTVDSRVVGACSVGPCLNAHRRWGCSCLYP